jgi:formylglycine-generating enzyme required for sulfatase activity/uncharacterized membrane protein YhaH (DUF805 family)
MEQWYIAKGGQQEGPVTPQQIGALVKAGSLDPATAMVWREGLTDWKTLSEAGLLAEIGTIAPPVTGPTIDNPYHVTERTRNSVAQSRPDAPIEHPGYGRLRYFLSLFVTTIIFYAILFAVTFAMFSNSSGSGAGPGIAMALLVLLVIGSSIYFHIQRLKNLGMSGWAMLWLLVPIMNIWITWRMVSCPAGYEHHRELDTPGWRITAIWIGMLALSIVGGIVDVYFSVKAPGLEVANMPPVFDAPTPRVQETNRGSRAGEEREFAEMKFVWCPPGRFTMGSPASEQGRFDREAQVEVTLSEGFWLGKYEVTQEEWERVMNTNPSAFTGDPSRPVEKVSWHDAVAYCAALTTSERAAGHCPATWSYRLPTEAEWEYACRAGTTTRFSFGDDDTLLTNYAWYGSNSDSTTHPVGQKRANPWGLYDMHGNVFEWCQDWYGDYPAGSATDPQGPQGGSLRVLRGGSWGDFAGLARCANRGSLDPVLAIIFGGFRAVLAPGQP